LKGVSQGCVMSSLLFNLYIADLEERFKIRGIGGVGLSKKRIWKLAYYADVLLALYY